METISRPRPTSIQQRFEEFHLANPHVYNDLARLARQARARGQQRIGIELLFAVLRWEHMMRTEDTDASGFKLNNSFRSRYARLLMEREPDLDGLFEVRSLHSV